MNKTNFIAVAGMLLATVAATGARAETITIGKGTGILWEGMAFNKTLSKPLESSNLRPQFGLLAISDSTGVCIETSKLKNIGGYLALPLQGVQGVGLVPRSSGKATYYRYGSGSQSVLTGTIGLPETRGSSSSNPSITAPILVSSTSYQWCLPPDTTSQNNFYSSYNPRTATISGSWALVADGTQQSGLATVPPMYFATFSAVGAGDDSTPILPSNIDLRISTLECTVSTPLAIDFGPVARNTQANAELAKKSVSMVTTCGQQSDYINANINLQFRAISGLYNSATSRLALNQGGGYITGEINNGVTGSGVCTATSGLNFDSRMIKLGNITTAQTSKVFTNQVIWRLCSGGTALPSGAVTASTEMVVTFN